MIQWAAHNSCEVMALAFEPDEGSELQKAFYLESVAELANNFKNQGVAFFILKGSPVIEIPRWVESNQLEMVLTQDCFNLRDRQDLSLLEKKMGSQTVRSFFGQSLIDKDRLPFEISKLPVVFTEFRKVVERSECFAPEVSTSLSDIKGFSPQLPRDVVFSSQVSSVGPKRYAFDLKAGESAALQRVEEYIWESQNFQNYKETRNGMLLKNDSSKFSVGLGLGCLSVRRILSEVKRFEDVNGANESTQWFIYELLWRDYFKFLALKIGLSLFFVNGISKKVREWDQDTSVFADWCSGRTGADFIDANMLELKQTGWMSNRGRQNVASYLAKTLKVNWTWGAEFFERNLIDFDTESNWGNWLYVAGVGTDPRDRVFNYERQAEMYDADFSYRKTWLRQS